jgi:hypothetical protein
MTKLGKFLVFFNLVLSLMFAAWAVGVYTQRVNWADAKGKTPDDERSWGRIAKLKDDIERVNGTAAKAGPRGLAELRWLTALDEIRAAEKQRDENRVVYADALEAVYTGKTVSGNEVTGPVKRPVYVKGELQVQKTLPVLEVVPDKGNNPLKPRVGLEAEAKQLNEDTVKVQEEIAALRKQAEDLTAQVHKLFTEIERAGRVRQGSLEEQQYLERVLYNVQVEADLLVERQKELEARLNELKGG